MLSYFVLCYFVLFSIISNVELVHLDSTVQGGKFDFGGTRSVHQSVEQSINPPGGTDRTGPMEEVDRFSSKRRRSQAQAWTTSHGLARARAGGEDEDVGFRGNL